MSELLDAARKFRDVEIVERLPSFLSEDVLNDPALRKLLVSIMKQVNISAFGPGETTCWARISGHGFSDPPGVTFNPRCGPGDGTLFTIPIWLNSAPFMGSAHLRCTYQYGNIGGHFVQDSSWPDSITPDEEVITWKIDQAKLPSPLSAVSELAGLVGPVMALSLYTLGVAAVDFGLHRFGEEFFEVYDFLRESWDLAIQILEDPTMLLGP